MLHVMAVIRVQAEHLATVNEALIALAEKTRSERGCIQYEVFQRVDAPVLVTQEVWADPEAEAAHLAGPNVAEVVRKVGSLLAAPVEIHSYTQIA